MEQTTNNICELSIDFEIKRTPVRLGKSDRYIYFDFNDTNFPVRLKKIYDEIIRHIDIESKNIHSNDTDVAISAWVSVDKYIKEKFDYAFGYGVSETAFGEASAMSVTENGEYYFENFLNALLPLIESQYDFRMNKVSSRVKTYTDRKGLHPALKR